MTGDPKTGDLLVDGNPKTGAEPVETGEAPTVPLNPPHGVILWGARLLNAAPAHAPVADSKR